MASSAGTSNSKDRSFGEYETRLESCDRTASQTLPVYAAHISLRVVSRRNKPDAFLAKINVASSSPGAICKSGVSARSPINCPKPGVSLAGTISDLNSYIRSIRVLLNYCK